MEWGKGMAHARRWMGHDWSKMCPSSASLRAHTTALLDDKWAQFSQGPRQRSCSTGWHVVYSITYCSRVDTKQWGNGWAVGRSRVTGGTEETTTIVLQSLLQPNIIILWCPHTGAVMKNICIVFPPYSNSACIQLWVIAQSFPVCLTSLTGLQVNLT